MWKVIHTASASAQTIMDLDNNFLMTLEDQPILHLYDFIGPSATYGYFEKPETLLTSYAMQTLDLGRRPTGGGIIFHTVDLAFSVLVPSSYPGYSINTLDNYAFVNEAVIEAVKPFLKEEAVLLPQDPKPKTENCAHFCMAKPTIFDVMVGNRKIAGAAQRRKSQGFLHQGSIAITLPATGFLEKVLLADGVKQAMQQYTFALLPHATESQISEIRELLKQNLKKIFSGSL